MTKPAPASSSSDSDSATTTAPKTLAIRNLTAEPVSIVLAEYLPPAASSRASVFTTIASCFWRADTASPVAPPAATFPASDADKSDDEGRTSQPLSVTIAPFATHATTLAIPAARNTLRITILSGTQPHRFQATVPPPAPRAAPLANLDASPRTLEALYLPGPACLAILAPGDPLSWMKSLRDELPLSALSIPGTHNSPTYHMAFPSARCQAVNIKTQLDNGIRFLDVRVSTSRHDTPPPSSQSSSPAPAPAPHHHPLYLVHGGVSVSIFLSRRFADLLSDVYAFLDAHPSETIILSLKREGLGSGTDADLCRRLKEVYCAGCPEKWYTGTRIPTLGESRGKIVLLRRFLLDETLRQVDDATAGHPSGSEVVKDLQPKLGWGASGDAWPDNVEDGVVGGGHIRIQDYYGIMVRSSIERKINACRVALELAASQRYAVVRHAPAAEVTLPPPMFINFFTGSNFFNPGCWPERIAAKVNPAMLEYLCVNHGENAKGPNGLEVGDGSTGVVLTDWLGVGGDWDLIRCVMSMNTRLQVGRQEHLENV